MMLHDLVDPIITAMSRHAARLRLLAQTNRPGMSEDFREESANVCENDIQNIIQPGYQAVVEAEPDPEKKVRVLADSQKQLKDLVSPRLPQVGNRPDEGYYSIFIEGSVGAARAVYVKIATSVENRTKTGSVASLELRRSLAIGSAKLDRHRAEQIENEAME